MKGARNLVASRMCTFSAARVRGRSGEQIGWLIGRQDVRRLAAAGGIWAGHDLNSSQRPGIAHSHRMRGSTARPRHVGDEVPDPPEQAPTNAHPATRSTSRVPTASYINRPRPGHDVDDLHRERPTEHAADHDSVDAEHRPQGLPRRVDPEQTVRRDAARGRRDEITRRHRVGSGVRLQRCIVAASGSENAIAGTARLVVSTESHRSTARATGS